jgi:hypothetical protein
LYCSSALHKSSKYGNNKIIQFKGDEQMFANYKGKLLAIMWMGVGSAILTSIFSSVIIAYVLKINKKVNRLSTR